MRPIGPQPGPQRAFAACPADICVFGGQAGGGKEIPLPTLVQTPLGPRPIGDLAPGDVVFGRDGRPCNVTWASAPNVPEVAYRLTFDNGVSIEACAEHQWVTYTDTDRRAAEKRTPEARAKRRAKRPSRAGKGGVFRRPDLAEINRARAAVQTLLPPPTPSVRSTQDIVDTLRVGGVQRVNHSIPITGVLEYPTADLSLLDPYLLGLWIGDGYTKSGGFCSADPELWEAWTNAGWAQGKAQIPDPAKPFYGASLTGLVGVLRTLGVLGNKHVPPAYMYADAAQRLALLQGLVDTDGHIERDKGGRVEFCNTNHAIARAVYWLAASLGAKPTIKEARATLYGKDCGPKWSVYFTPAFEPCRLPRKLAQWQPVRRATQDHHYIVAAERLENPPLMRCIAVDSPDNTYLITDACIPTHNSFAVAYEPLKWVHIPGFAGILFRRDTTQITGPGSLWEQAQKLYPATGARLVQSPTLVARWETPRSPTGLKDAEVHFRHLQHEWTVQDHDGKEYVYVGIDEGQYFTGGMIWYMWGRCRTLCGVRPYMRITCNPDPDCYLRTLLDWWIGPDGYPIPERDGVIRWCLNIDDAGLTWFDTEAEALEYVKALQSTTETTDDSIIKHLAPTSVTFIKSSLSDNAALLAQDATYGARLAMDDADTRARKLGGNWNSRPKAGEMFDSAWFGFCEPPAPSDIAFSVRGWDKAATLPSDRSPNPDWTRGALMHHLRNGHVVIADVVGIRDAPGKVDALVSQTAEADGPGVTQAFWRDPGQAGVVDEVHTRDVLRKVACGPVDFEKETKSKVHYAKEWSAFADPATYGGQRRMWLVRAPWNKDFLSEANRFPKPTGVAGRSVKDDIIDSVSRGWRAIQARTSGAARFMAAVSRMR